MAVQSNGYEYIIVVNDCYVPDTLNDTSDGLRNVKCQSARMGFRRCTNQFEYNIVYLLLNEIRFARKSFVCFIQEYFYSIHVCVHVRFYAVNWVDVVYAVPRVIFYLSSREPSNILLSIYTRVQCEDIIKSFIFFFTFPPPPRRMICIRVMIITAVYITQRKKMLYIIYLSLSLSRLRTFTRWLLQ